MAKSTIVFGIICLLLAGAFTVVIWWIKSPSAEKILPSVRGSLSIGLPTEEQNNNQERINAISGLLWDTEVKVILFEKNGFERRPIASITKLMTAMVALDEGIDWEAEATIEPNEYVMGGQLLLHAGEHVTMRDLWYASLLGSANNATLALVRELGVPEKEFVREMNRKAIEYGLEQTEFVEVTGLDPDNLSTAYEVARMAEAAFRDYPLIAETTAKKDYTFTVGGSGREHTIRNTNKLIAESNLTLTGGKTGYLYEASYCLVAQGSGLADDRIAIVLGSPDEEGSMRDVRNLLDW